MDRLEQDSSRKPLHDAFAPAHRTDVRPLHPPDRGADGPDPGAGELDLAGTGQRPNFRLDSGHHQTRSRWLPPHPRPARGRPHRPGPSPIGGPPVACSVLVGSGAARTLAAMVNWIVPAGADGGAGPTAGQPAGLDPSGLATIGGADAGDPVGLVRFGRGPSPRPDSYVLTHPGRAGTEALALGADAVARTVERYSLEPGLEWWAGDLRGDRGRYRFRAYWHGEFCTEVRLQVPGAHQVLPALAAVAIGVHLRLAPGEIRDRLEEFAGVPRGFESRGSWRGATLVDDEASGSGGVGVALRLAREVFGGRTLRAVYLPNAAGSLAGGPPAPAEFAEANHLLVINAAAPWPEWTRQLAASLRSSGALVASCSSLEQAIHELDRSLEPGDVLVTLGASEVGTIADAFLRRLSRDRHG